MGLCSGIGLTSCDDAEFKYSNFHCNLLIDNSKHVDATLASAMNPFAKGIFCRITFQMKSGAKHFIFENTNGDRSEKIRTYNYPQNRVTDHRIGLTITQLDRIMEGKLDGIIEGLTAEEERRKLEETQL